MVTAADEAFKARMAESVEALWPELRGRLGEQLGAFVDAASLSAVTHQIGPDAPMARFVNLCCAFGPNFERRPENEWALAILADERLPPWVRLHQLVVRGAAELKRRPSDGRATSDQLLRADGLLLDAMDARVRADSSESVPLTRLACDLEAVDIRLLELDWRREYRQLEGVWQLVPFSDLPASIRIGAGRPAPPMVCVLTQPPGSGPAARLQVRLLTHSVCDQDRHPFVSLAGQHGLWAATGHAARAISWLVEAPPPVVASNGLGVMLIEETVAQTSLLRATTCGLRDEGVPTGSLETYTWAYPADQWLFAWQREAGAETHWPRPEADRSTPAVAPATRCRIERNGALLPSARWAEAFHDTLDLELARGFDKLFAVWQGAATQCTMTSVASVLAGRSTLAWGWREGADGLAGKPLMRVLGEIDLSNTVDLLLSGELVLGVTRTQVRIRVQGTAVIQQQVAREEWVPGLLDVLLPVAVRWRFNYRLEFDPIAVDEGAIWSEAGPCTGALVGEAGIRPRSTGGGGWQWYARLASEAVSFPVCVHDPVLGQTRRTVALLPATPLLDWSLG